MSTHVILAETVLIQDLKLHSRLCLSRFKKSRLSYSSSPEFFKIDTQLCHLQRHHFIFTVTFALLTFLFIYL